MRSAIRKRMTGLLVTGLLFAAVPTTAAFARPVSGGNEVPGIGTLVNQGLVPSETLQPSSIASTSLYSAQERALMNAVAQGMVPEETLESESFRIKGLINQGLIPAKAACLLPREVLKNEPRLCAPADPSPDAPPAVERTAPTAPTSSPAPWEVVGASLLVIAALSAFVAGRRPQHARS
jgi:hypothetical protein